MGVAGVGAGPWAKADDIQSPSASNTVAARWTTGVASSWRGITTLDTRGVCTRVGSDLRGNDFATAKRYLRKTPSAVASTTFASDFKGRSFGQWSQCNQASGRPNNSRAIAASSEVVWLTNRRKAMFPSQCSSVARNTISSPHVVNATLTPSPSATPSGRSIVNRAPPSDMSLLRAETDVPSDNMRLAGMSAITRAFTRDCSRSRPTETAAADRYQTHSTPDAIEQVGLERQSFGRGDTVKTYAEPD